MRSRMFWIFWMSLTLLAALALPARAVLPSQPGDWQSLPIWAGDVRAIAIHPEDPDLVLTGTSAGQLYVSRDGGRGWTVAGAPLPFPGWVIGALRFDPNRTSRVWMALWGIWGSGHVAYSDDLGKSWVARAGGLPDEPVYTIALVPGREGHLYAGTLSGVWGTENGGETWRRLTADLPEAQKVTSLLVDSTQPDTVIAGTWRRAYRSDDGGKTWSGIFEGMVLDSEVFSLTPVPGRPGEIWATTCGWVYQTKDRGARWERFKEGFVERRTPSFAALPDGRLLAGTVGGLHLSADGGKTWKLVGDPALAIHAIAIHPARPERILLATEGSGVWASTDGAATFHPSSEGMTNFRVSALAVMGRDLLVGVVHAGPMSGVHVSRDLGKTFGDFRSLPNVLDFGVHLGRLYAATEKGLYELRGADWFRLKELGEERVEEVVAEGEQIVVRTASALYGLEGGKFVKRPYKHGAPRSAAFFGDALWVSDAQAVYRLTQSANDTVEAPFTGGRLYRLPDQLLLWGSGGAWVRAGDGDGSSWVSLTDKGSRVIATGDARWSAVLVSGDVVRLYDREASKFEVLEVPIPVRDISSAVIGNGRLFLGTSGYGVLVKRLE
ncbi:MAG TPA: YCF48-related protein [Thermoanaerobaculia bacterium]